MTGGQRHHTHVEMSRCIPPHVEAGTNITLKVKVACAAGCDLRGRLVRIVTPLGFVVESTLVDFDETTNETGELVVTAPRQVDEHSWRIVFPRHEGEGILHEESDLTVSSTTIPHTTSVAVWKVPSPVVVDSSFTVNVGTKCSVACQLAGQLVVVRNEAGHKVSEGRLGDTPFPGTSALYEAEVSLAAPATEGMYAWSATFAGAGLDIPHEDASATFSFRTARPPEHRVTVTVSDRDTDAPLETVQVQLGVYRAATDERGRASLEVPTGTYDLSLRKVGYETHTQTVEVTKSVTIQVSGVPAPDTDPDEEQVWM